MTADREKKILRLEEIFTSYLEKDIAGFLQVENRTAFRKLAALIASQQGALVNTQELSETLGIHRETVSRYLLYLEETFVTTRIKPFFSNPRSELTKMPKIFFSDPGFRNLMLGYLSYELPHFETGPVLEGIAADALIRTCRFPQKVNFWRTTSGAEVDFIVADPKPAISVEVKAGEISSIRVTRGYRSFLAKYRPAKALLLNRNLWAEKVICDHSVEAIPLSVFLAQPLLLQK